MTTLGIFTVKNLLIYEGDYYTYGGFGEYLDAMRKSFKRVVLFAHVRAGHPPNGYYLIRRGDDLKVVHLKFNRSEFNVLMSIPSMWRAAWQGMDLLDVVHARMPDYTGLIGALVARIRHVPLFCQIIADWHVEAQKMPAWKKYGLGTLMKLHLYLYALLERQICKGQLVFAQGTTCFQKHASNSDCEEVLSTSIHLDDIVPPRRKFAGERFHILSVARLTGVKNQALILQALGRLRDMDRRWCAGFVGQGPQEAFLKSLVSRLGLQDAVEFHGQVSRGPALWSHFDRADCFVLSSRSEGTPKVLLESMARGLPIVASNVSGVPSMVQHGVSGLLYEDNDVEGLVNALRKLAESPQLCDSMAAAAQAFCQEHTVELATARMLDKVYARWPALTQLDAR